MNYSNQAFRKPNKINELQQSRREKIGQNSRPRASENEPAQFSTFRQFLFLRQVHFAVQLCCGSSTNLVIPTGVRAADAAEEPALPLVDTPTLLSPCEAKSLFSMNCGFLEH
jgi:hypothetical protein